MKKLTYLLGLLVVASAIFTSCSKDETEPDPPSITFLGGTEPSTGWERVDGDVSLTVGEPFVFGFTASSNSDKNLSTIKVTRNYENVTQSTLLDSAVSVKSFTIDIQTIAFPNVPGSEVFEVTVTDKNGKSSSLSFTVTTTAVDPGITEYNNVELGSYDLSTPSSFASITGETFEITAATADEAIQAKIDWVYFDGATGGHTIMSPANASIEAIYPSIAGWTNRNSTLMAKTTLSVNDYESIETKTQMIAVISNQGLTFDKNFYSENTSNPGGFSVGDIFACETSTGKYALIKIIEVNQGASNGKSTIKYNIKVEK